MKNFFILFFVSLMLIIFPLRAARSLGTIEGKVSEDFRKIPLSGVLIQVVNTTLSTLSNEKGEFEILNVPVGSYNVKFSISGFKTVVRTDVMVRPNRITYIKTQLEEHLLPLHETVEVTASYFHENEQVPNSVFNLSTEEVRRAPGTGSGVSRMLRSLPGITMTADVSNELIVRGGHPYENGFYIDNIEVPLINHIPFYGTSGGFWSAIDPDLVQNIDFFSGGFSSSYGDRLSSVTDITLREGNKNEFDGQINLNLINFGGVLEGPIKKGKGAWLFSLRKSFLDSANDIGLLKLDDDGLPKSFDTQMKLTYDLSPRHKINLLYFHGQGNYIEDPNAGIDVTHPIKYTQHTLGINWVSTWKEKFFSNTSLSYSSLSRFYGDVLPGGADAWTVDDRVRYFILRNLNLFNLNYRNKFQFGFQMKYETDDIDHMIYRDENGNIIPLTRKIGDFSTTKYSLFFSYISNPFNRLTTTIGFRGDYSSAHHVFHLSPRLSLNYQISDKLSLNGGFGIVYQTIPMNFLAYLPEAVNVKDMKAIHYLLGLKYFSGVGTKISLEAFYKKYEHLPVSPDSPTALISDWILYSTYNKNDYAIRSYVMPSSLDNDGTTGYSRGIELFIQQKLVKKFYCIFSASYFRSRYKDLLGIMRDRIFDNRYILNLMLGYKFSKKWEISTRWIVMGGAPYTPTDIQQSQLLNEWILDMSRYNSARYPKYETLNFRVDRRWYFGKSSLILYLDIWNVFGRENVRAYVWDTVDGSYNTDYQLATLPILGLEFEF